MTKRFEDLEKEMTPEQIEESDQKAQKYMEELGVVEYETSCPLCGTRKTFTLPEKEYRRWRDGALIQNVFPQLTIDEREQLISGICPKCWELMENI